MAYPNVDIKNLTLAQAKAIYRKDYWDKFGCDLVPDGVSYVLFDAAVNHGGRQAIKFLQQAVGATADGYIGPKTLLAVRSAKAEKVLTEFCYHRMIFYTNISTFGTYKKGWTRRLIETFATAMKQL